MGYGKLWIWGWFGYKIWFGDGPNLWVMGLYGLRQVWVMKGSTVDIIFPDRPASTDQDDDSRRWLKRSKRLVSSTHRPNLLFKNEAVRCGIYSWATCYPTVSAGRWQVFSLTIQLTKFHHTIMRFLSIFALACTVVQAVSALPVFNPTRYAIFITFHIFQCWRAYVHIIISDLIAHDDLYIGAEHLEARGKGHQHKDSKKHVSPPPSPVTFLKENRTHSPKNNLDRLKLHGQKRKNVEKWHQDVVTKHMKTVKGAHTAEIV